MKNLILIILASLVTPQLFAQKLPCEGLIERVELPAMHSINSPLPPDPCDALSSYGTEKSLTVSATPEYLEIKKRVRVVVETLWNPEDCTSESREVSRDTIIVSQERIYAASTTPVGGFWTVRMELMMYAPNSRPDGCYATKLPSGALSQQYRDGSTIDLKEYWVVHTGEYNTKAEAIAATKQLKGLHPEFCRAYPYLLPTGCRYQYQYKSNSN